ncbi:N-acetylmuramoyl-L-alanine amidase [Aeromonas diversa CDC 2478-85]|uniref:N-acetylmuramoyl-L-alanine amidase n=1 Tax=Aeromonas diversa CDC 2478-85 TaxID=1268237 RepID=N9VRE2_9GAMM|nr:N-acetylmuramoyl-L-alanine amidase [Aeromonas diversa]ENY73896.1 N-acetylmuramoyl-L-alanine amidase [Aeromonas diversa CDC 2478-85]
MRLLIACLLAIAALPAWANQLKGVRIWPSPDSTRVVFDMASAPDYQFQSLSNPARLIIDIKNTSNGTNLARVENTSQVVRWLRESTAPQRGSIRLVLDLSEPIKPVVFPLAPAGPYGHRLVIDLPYEEKGSQPTSKPVARGGHPEVVIAIDAGHGGEDPGSIGPRRTFEKRVTLAISQHLAALIDREPGMRAVMTRRGDYFVDLNRRSEIARKGKSDLLISVHADSFNSSAPRGASVWVLSTNRANREMGRWLEQQEKQSELLGGVGKVIAESDPNPYLARTFLDLSMDKSRAEGYDVSRQILRHLGQVARLHKKAPQHASLAVLKSPDIPSVLVETGFISNHDEEKLLGSSAYQQKVARAIFQGIRTYYRSHPTKGPMLTGKAKPTQSVAAAVPERQVVQPAPVSSGSGAGVIKPYSEVANAPSRPVASVTAQASGRHLVKRGESLSLLALRYGTTQAALVELNNLRSREIQIGQTLRVPATQVTSTVKPPLRHQVKRGESLSRLAERYGLTQARLVEYNNLKSREIQIGQVLKIPQE